MTPYYTRDGVTLYLGDCKALLPVLAVGGPICVVTDPPYGTGWILGGGAKQGEFSGRLEGAEWDVWDDAWLDLVTPDPKCWAVFCPDMRVTTLAQALGKHSLRYYVKTNPRPPLGGKDSPSVEPIVVAPRVRFGSGPAHFLAYNGDAMHPCQKPETLMRWLVEGVADPLETVLDPFAGSGTTLVACAQLRRQAVGIEREERYCEMAALRIDAAFSGVGISEHLAGQADLFSDAS